VAREELADGRRVADVEDLDPGVRQRRRPRRPFPRRQRALRLAVDREVSVAGVVPESRVPGGELDELGPDRGAE